MLADVLAVFVSAKFAEVAPVALATTLYGPPAVAFAVKVVDVATPLPFVVAVVVAVPLANVPLAPLAGAVKVTITWLTGLFRESFTVAWNAVAKGLLITALCGVPLVGAMLAGEPALTTMFVLVPVIVAFAVSVAAILWFP